MVVHIAESVLVVNRSPHVTHEVAVALAVSQFGNLFLNDSESVQIVNVINIALKDL